ncbi:MAG: hypothetical protein WCG23_11395 [bacterium]
MRVKFNGNGSFYVVLEDLDLCLDCTRKTRCPLIHTLKDNVTALRSESIRIDYCRLHKKRGNKQCQKSKLTD